MVDNSFENLVRDDLKYLKKKSDSQEKKISDIRDDVASIKNEIANLKKTSSFFGSVSGGIAAAFAFLGASFFK